MAAAAKIRPADPYRFLAIAVLVAPASGLCNIPVFRYALERWPAADLPGEVDGVPVRVEVVGEIRSLTG